MPAPSTATPGKWYLRVFKEALKGFADATPEIVSVVNYSASVGVDEIENMLEFPHTTGNSHKSDDKIASLLGKTRAWLQGRGGGDPRRHVRE